MRTAPHRWRMLEKSGEEHFNLALSLLHSILKQFWGYIHPWKRKYQHPTQTGLRTGERAFVCLVFTCDKSISLTLIIRVTPFSLPLSARHAP